MSEHNPVDELVQTGMLPTADGEWVDDDSKDPYDEMVELAEGTPEFEALKKKGETPWLEGISPDGTLRYDVPPVDF